jgi:hypothetical protein
MLRLGAQWWRRWVLRLHLELKHDYLPPLVAISSPVIFVQMLDEVVGTSSQFEEVRKRVTQHQ